LFNWTYEEFNVSNKKNRNRVASSTPIPDGQRANRRRHFARVQAGVAAIVRAPADFLKKPLAPGELPSFRDLDILGTGFVVDGSGIVLTAAHVIDPWVKIAAAHARGEKVTPENPKLMFFQPSREGHSVSWSFFFAESSFFATANGADLAALYVPPPPANHPLKLAPLPISSAPCEIGDEVAVCGFPFGRNLHADQLLGTTVASSFASGLVSAMLPFPGAPAQHRTFVQLDMSVNGGNSGGPVFDVEHGKVVGIVVNAFTQHVELRRAPADGDAQGTGPKGHTQVPTGIARAIDIRVAMPLIESMRTAVADVKAGRPPFLRLIPPSSKT
jgi:S1-C subfamily serine protease